jgi:hypothetical protein
MLRVLKLVHACLVRFAGPNRLPSRNLGACLRFTVLHTKAQTLSSKNLLHDKLSYGSSKKERQ